MTTKRLFVGAHPGYQRAQDVRVQTLLARPEILVVTSLDALSNQIQNWA